MNENEIIKKKHITANRITVAAAQRPFGIFDQKKKILNDEVKKKSVGVLVNYIHL